MSRDPLAPFDESVIEAVATARDRDPDAVRELVARHQVQMRELPGVENLVYEWRKTQPHDPLVQRREGAYLLVVERTVWPQFGAALDIDDEELAAIRAVHARQLAVETEAAGLEYDPERDDRDAMIVTRE